MPDTTTSQVNFDDLIPASDLTDAPLSAFTPGQGDPKMEGGFQTFSGAPMQTLEMYHRGEADYVTGATNNPADIGKKLWRKVGNQNVLVGITDYGPGVKGIDIASENKAWATNFPYQGQRGGKSNGNGDVSFDDLVPKKIDPKDVRRALPNRDVSGNVIPYDKPARQDQETPPHPITAQEQSTLAVPDEARQTPRALGVNEVPSRFAKPETVDQIVDRSIPKVNPDNMDFVPRRPPEGDGDIGTRSLAEAYQTGGLEGAGAYIGSMQSLPFVAPAARAAIKLFPGLSQLDKIAGAFPQTPSGKIARGLEDTLVDSVSMLSSPTNLALMASGQAIEGVTGKLITGWFMGQMARQFPEQWREFTQAKDLGERTRLLGNMAVEAGIIYAGAKSIKGDITPEERATKAKLLKEYLEPIKAKPPIQGGETTDATTSDTTTSKIPSEQGKPVEQQTKSEVQTGDTRDTPAKEQEKPVAQLLNTSDLPEHSQGAIQAANRSDMPGITQSKWSHETVPIESLRSGNEMIFDPDSTFIPRGSKNKGPLVVNSTGEIVDGNNRLYEAIKRGDKNIEIFREKPVQNLAGEQADYEAQLLAEAEEHMRRGGDELLDVLKQHGLPLLKSGEHYKGEVDSLRELFKDKKGFSQLVSGLSKEKLKYSDIFKKGAGSLDSLTDVLRNKGFPIDGVSDVLDMIQHRLSTGKKIYGDESFAESMSHDEPSLFGGPGAAGASETLRPDEPTAKQLSDMFASSESGDPLTFTQRLSETKGRTKEIARSALDKSWDIVKRTANGFKKHTWDPPTRTNFQRWMGRWDRSLQYNDYYITQLGHELERVIPKRARQESIYNWAAADGDEATLRQWADRSPTDVKQGYLDALHLTDDEQVAGNRIRSAYDEWLQRAIENGMLEKGVENYLKRVVTKRPEIQQAIMAKIATGKFSTNFREAKHRFWTEMVDAERAGVRYDKRLRTTSLYAQSFEHAAINKKMAQQLVNMDVGNGLPAVMVEGSAREVEGDQKSPALLVTPFGKSRVKGAADLARELKDEHPTWTDEHAYAIAKEKILSQYSSFDHPAFSNWQWVHETPEGQHVYVRGNALVHNSIAPMLERAFLKERLTWLDPILRAQGFVKGSKLSLSFFHQAHEMVNAFSHLTNMFNLKPLSEYLQDKEIQSGMEGGLKLVGSANEQAYFAEGMGSHGWPELVPGLGKYVRRYKDMLFTDYIPRLKASAYKNALRRNVTGGPTGLRSTKNLSLEQNQVLTARQINASFGELNYRQMMRDPVAQQILQGMFLAPDFGEAKLRHMGQLATRYGGEQRMAFGIVAGTLWFGARAINQAVSGNPQWDKPFTVVIGDRQYTIRSLPGDMNHLMTNPGSYAMYRLSPLFHTTVETLFSRDQNGNIVDWSDKVKDMVLSSAPIPLTYRKGIRWSDSLASAMGVTPTPYRYETEIRKRIADWRRKSGDVKLIHQQELLDHQAHLPSDYSAMRDALRDGNMPRAKSEFEKLQKTSGRSSKDISTVMSRWSKMPLTGSKTAESKFKKSLHGFDADLYEKAVRERKFIYSSYLSLLRGAKSHVYPDHLDK